MAKHVLTPLEVSELRQIMHVAVLDALVASRRWEPGELAFQGGTALHLIHGSPRFSEDIDFLVAASIDLTMISATLRGRMVHAVWIPRDATLTVTHARDAHNPHAFDVTLGGTHLIGSVRVRVKLWQTPADALHALRVQVMPARDHRTGLQAFIPTATASEIHVDKVFALAARSYLKPRDVFDLHWLRTHHQGLHCTLSDMAVRFATYPNMTTAQWLSSGADRRAELQCSAERIANDLSRWLPSSIPMTAQQAEPMIAASVAALSDAMDLFPKAVIAPAPSCR
jgi:predicted nucleotidyltransferase component of viral defense system